MNRRPLPLPAVVLGILGLLAVPVLLATAAVLSGCRSADGGPIAQPSRSFTVASRVAFDELAPRLRVYLDTDPELDPAERDVVLGLLGDWDLAIRAAEDFHRRGPDGIEDRTR
jgi:hypothetical protein